MIYSVKGLALLALALGMGYVVCVMASKESGFLRMLGYGIGILIIASCLVGAILRIYSGGPICVI